MKRLIVCCDGTWQSQDNEVPTNVFKFAQAVEQTADRDNIPQILYYDRGIGAVPSRGGTQSPIESIGDSIEKLGGGAFGWWIDEKIEEAYIFLCLNYQPGDEIYLLGFSRGAYTVRSLAGLINCCGLLERPDIDRTAEAYKIYRIDNKQQRQESATKFHQNNNIQSVKIKFLGCWDTVGALGIPDFTPLLLMDKLFNVKYQFHDTELSPIIENARHAIAIDEKQKALKVTIMKPDENFNGVLKQVWFPGGHGCVGGGTAETIGLSNAALKWMADEASELGLNLNFGSDLVTDYKTPLKERFMPIGKGERNISQLNDELPNGFKFDLDRDFHISVKQRWCDPNTQYRPQNLQEFMQDKSHNWRSSVPRASLQRSNVLKR